jgi:uncharacterized protein YkwD
MKTLSWLGAVVLFTSVALGTASVLRPHTESARSLTADTAVAAAHYATADAGDPARLLPAPISTPHRVAKPKAPPVKRAAPPATRPAPSLIYGGSTQQALINRDRARYGLRPLAWSSCLGAIAYSNAIRMARQGYISHTNGATRDLGCGLGYHAGENVGWYSAGVNDTWVNNAFMASPDHRANILSPYYRYVATSWVKGANGAYIAVEFS